jgi:hypothetical protein
MYSKGISWIDDCRIPFVDEGDNNTTRGQYENKVQVGIMADRPNIKFVGSFDDSAKQGRFPANLLVSDDMLNDGVITKTSQKNNIVKNTTQMFNYSPQREYPEIQDKGSSSRYYDIDKWFDNLING